MQVKVYITEGGRMVALGYISRDELASNLYSCIPWTKALHEPVSPTAHIYGPDALVELPTVHTATFEMWDINRAPHLVCIAGAKHLVDWHKFASFPEGREIARRKKS